MMKIDRDSITNKPKCYIFDIDGCMANTNNIILSKVEVYNLKLQKYNEDLEHYNINIAEYYKKLEYYNEGKIYELPLAPIPPVAPQLIDEKDQHSFDWEYFHDNLDKATPIWGVIDIFVALSQNYKVIIVTGRKEIHRVKTVNWLRDTIESRYGKDSWRRCNFTLIMRPDNDNSPSVEYKGRIFQDIYKQYNIQLIIEDHPDVLSLIDKLGLLSLRPNTLFKQVGNKDRLKNEGK